MYRILAENKAVPGAPGPAQPPEPSEARGGGPRAQRGVVLGHHAAAGAGSTSTSTSLLDIYSRYATGWMVAERETAGLARTPDRGELPEARCPARVVAQPLHSDRDLP